MKLMYGNTPVKSLNIHAYELNTNDCDMVASDLQAGKTAVARGQKITGTGKSFEFACYGNFNTNEGIILPTSSINVVHVSSMEYAVKSHMPLASMKSVDFSTSQLIGAIIHNNVEHPISAIVQNGELLISCDITTGLETFFGKDNYI